MENPRLTKPILIGALFMVAMATLIGIVSTSQQMNTYIFSSGQGTINSIVPTNIPIFLNSSNSISLRFNGSQFNRIGGILNCYHCGSGSSGGDNWGLVGGNLSNLNSTTVNVTFNQNIDDNLTIGNQSGCPHGFIASNIRHNPSYFNPKITCLLGGNLTVGMNTTTGNVSIIDNISIGLTGGSYPSPTPYNINTADTALDIYRLDGWDGAGMDFYSAGIAGPPCIYGGVAYSPPAVVQYVSDGACNARPVSFQWDNATWENINMTINLHGNGDISGGNLSITNNVTSNMVSSSNYIASGNKGISSIILTGNRGKITTTNGLITSASNVILGINTTIRGIYSSNAIITNGLVTGYTTNTLNPTPQSVTVSGVPFTYKNNDGYTEVIYITGTLTYNVMEDGAPIFNFTAGASGYSTVYMNPNDIITIGAFSATGLKIYKKPV